MDDNLRIAIEVTREFAPTQPDILLCDRLLRVCDAADALLADNERMRKALEKIQDEAYSMLDATYCAETCHSTEVTKEQMCKDISLYCNIADQALAVSPQEGE